MKPVANPYKNNRFKRGAVIEYALLIMAFAIIISLALITVAAASSFSAESAQNYAVRKEYIDEVAQKFIDGQRNFNDEKGFGISFIADKNTFIAAQGQIILLTVTVENGRVISYVYGAM